MIRHRSLSSRKFKPLMALAAVSVCASCGSPIDSLPVQEESLKPLKRYDVIQALGWNGEVMVGGSQAGAVVVSARTTSE